MLILPRERWTHTSEQSTASAAESKAVTHCSKADLIQKMSQLMKGERSCTHLTAVSRGDEIYRKIRYKTQCVPPGKGSGMSG